MKNISFCLIVFFIVFHSYSQVNTLNNSNKPKENIINNSDTKPLSNSNSKGKPRVRESLKRKQTPRKENHEIIPNKE